MAEFVRQRAVLDCHQVKSVVTTVDSLRDSSDLTWETAGIFANDDQSQNEQQVPGAPKYIVYACKLDREIYWRPTPTNFECVSIPNHVRELCDVNSKPRA